MNYITEINHIYRSRISEDEYKKIAFTMSQMHRLGELVTPDVLLEGLPRMIGTTRDLLHLHMYYHHVYESLSPH
jgi:hypothetical protein